MKYANCDRCGKSFEHCGFCIWCKCGRHWCGHDCAKADGYDMKDNDELIDVDIPIRELFSCDWCDATKFLKKNKIMKVLEKRICYIKK